MDRHAHILVERALQVAEAEEADDDAGSTNDDEKENNVEPREPKTAWGKLMRFRATHRDELNVVADLLSSSFDALATELQVHMEGSDPASRSMPVAKLLASAFRLRWSKVD